MNCLITSDNLANLARQEIDVKGCYVAAPTSAKPGIPNIANWSSQLNYSTGLWQIDGNPPGWLNTTFKPVITPDVPFPISMRYLVDTVNQKFSVLSTTWGSQAAYQIAAAQQGVAFEESDWQALVFALQLQIEVLNPGEASIEYNNITLTLSDQPF
jgi:hypothetical protein